MDSNYGEPSSKRARSEHVRYIKLDMAKYDTSVQNLPDEDLVKIFELGLNVRESAILTVDNQKMVEDALASKMKPVHDSVAKIEQQVVKQVEEVKKTVTQDVGEQMKEVKTNVEGLKDDVSKHMTKIKDELTGRVDTVAQKVEPLNVLNANVDKSAQDIKTQLGREIKESERRVASELAECKKRLESISTSLDKPSSKGARAERKVIEVLRDHLPSFSCFDTSSNTGKGDIEVQTPSNHSIMIEVKNKKASVPKNETESFEENLAKSPQFKVGILLSMASGIARRAREGRFEIAVNRNKQYQIYVPNAYANNEDHLIVWSVIMAEQLSNLEQDLDETKIQGLDQIYKKFQKNIEHSKLCKSNLEALETSVENLKSSITPILETVDETKNDIYKLLHY